GDVGGRRGTFEQESLLARAFWGDLEDDARKAQPVAGILRRGGSDLAENGKAAADIIAPEGGIRVGAQGRVGLADRPRLAIDLGFQLDRGIREIVAPEGLVGGLHRYQAKRQRCADCDGANQTNHDGLPGARTSTAYAMKCAER